MNIFLLANESMYGLLWMVLVIFSIIVMWMIFEKAGQAGWKAIIPIYNVIVLLQIVGKPWWWLLLICFIPIVNIILSIWVINLLAKSFGKGVGFTIGLIILPFIFFPILAFGKASYTKPA